MTTVATPAPTWTTGTTEGIRTGTWRAALPEHVTLPSPCQAACPVEGEIAVWMKQLERGDVHGAWRTLIERNPFPAIAGRVCHHPCEPACNRGAYDEALSICRLERYAGDAAIAAGWRLPEPERERRERVAVVGGGPAGLAAAYHLRRLGYGVTVFEAGPALGGLLRYGIPAYRLPKEVLDAELERLFELGVEARCNRPLTGSAELDRLREDYHAVFLATGAARPRRLPQLDYDAPWAMDGAEVLARVNAGERPPLGRRVLVVGGGSAAMDVARSARRLGCEVTVLALEDEAMLPASREEVIEAREEDVHFLTGAMLERAARAGAGIVVDYVAVAARPGTRPGTLEVTRKPGTEARLEADCVVTAIGQDPALDAFADIAPADGGVLAIDDHGRTNRARVYAGGDLASLARFVTEAFGMGRRAAATIDADLRHADPPPRIAGGVPVESIATFYHPLRPRASAGHLAPAERLAGFAEVQRPLEAQAARRESTRCFSCGHCIHCDNCVYVCPDVAVMRTDGGYAVRGDYCKGCGLCVRECPTGAMRMVEERR